MNCPKKIKKKMRLMKIKNLSKIMMMIKIQKMMEEIHLLTQVKLTLETQMREQAVNMKSLIKKNKIRIRF
jgi:hypothetical protein